MRHRGDTVMKSRFVATADFFDNPTLETLKKAKDSIMRYVEYFYMPIDMANKIFYDMEKFYQDSLIKRKFN